MSSEVAVCRFEPCTREVYVEKWQLCSAHYNQQCRGRDLRPLRGTPEWRSIDHECCRGAGSCGQCVRGLLCDSCNKLLGHAQDSTSLLRSAASYLESVG